MQQCVRLRAITLLVVSLTPAILAHPAALSFRPLFAEYSASLDRIILASDNPPQLHSYDPVSRATQSVGLPKAALSLRLAPDGARAVVGHDALVSVVNLSSLAIERNVVLPFTANHVAIGSLWIWAWTTDKGAAVNLSTGAVSATVTPGADGRFSPRLNAVVALGSYGGIAKADVSSGLVGTVNSAFTTQVGPFCAPLYLSGDEQRAYSGCGVLALLGESVASPNRYEMRIADVRSLKSLSESVARNEIALVPGGAQADDSYVWVFDREYLNPRGRFALTDFPGGARAHGRWVFHNASLTALYVVSQADAFGGLALDFGGCRKDCVNAVLVDRRP